MYVDRFGLPERQIVGQLVEHVTAAAFPQVESFLRGALAGKVQRLEPRMISVDGERTLSVTHLPHRDETGRVVGVIVYGYDITEQRRAEAALIQSEKLAAVGRLASSIAHEINNPLESVTNLLYLLETTVGQDPDEVRQYVKMAQQELRRASQIATQTLRFFRQSTGRLCVELGEVMESVLALYAGRLANSGIAVRREFQGEVMLTCFDGELRQVLNNLIGNAIDAMRGGGRLRVRVCRMANGLGVAGVRLTVADTGSGMSSEVLARALSRSLRLKGFPARDWGFGSRWIWSTRKAAACGCGVGRRGMPGGSLERYLRFVPEMACIRFVQGFETPNGKPL